MIFPRKEAKGHGTGKVIEGRYEKGETAVVIDDLISSGGSKLEAIEPLEAAGLVVNDVVVLIDREGTGREELAAAGYRLHSVVTLSEITDTLEAEGLLTSEQADEVRAYIASQGSS
jgi:uridine monophosphate synthetase